MKVANRWLRALSIHPGEAPRVFALILYSVANGIFTSFFIATANALFLEQFGVATLPWVYIAAAVVAYFMITLFSKLQKRIPIGNFLIANSFLLLTIVAGGWIAYQVIASRWIAFLIFVTLTPSLSLASLGYWGLAGSLLDLRQSKRLFGLVSTGSVLASMTGFFLIRILVRWLDHSAHLLLFSAAGMALSILTLSVTVRKFKGELSLLQETASEERSEDSFSTYLKEPYFILLSAAAILLVLAFYLLDLSFLNQVKLRFQDSVHVAQFLGLFFGCLKVIELILKTFAAGRLLSFFGVRLGLFSLPAILVSVVSAGSLIGVFLGPEHVLFYLSVAAGKMAWIIVRQSFYDPSIQVLYQPLPLQRRLDFQAQLGVVGLALTLVIGVTLLLVGRDGLNTFYVFLCLLPVFAAWVFVAVKIHKAYRDKLLQNLAAVGSREPVKSPVEMLAEQVRTGPPEDLRYYLDVLESIDPTTVEPLLAEKLGDVLPQVREGALKRIGRRRALGVLDAVTECVRRDRSALVSSTARETLSVLTELRELTADRARLEALGRSDDAGDRKLAAEALGWTREARGAEDLGKLISDRNRDVRRAAIVAAGRLGHPRFWPQIVAYLASPQTVDAATHALILIGEPALPEMELAFRRGDQELSVKLRLLNIYDRIGGDRVRVLLRDKLRDPDKAVREQALRILSAAPPVEDEDLVRRAAGEIEKTVGAVVWNSAALLDLGDDPAVADVRDALECELRQNRAAIFLLLALIYDPSAVELVRENIEGHAEEGTVYALEMLELLVSAQLKPLVVPALEDLTPAQILRQLGRFYPKQRISRIERLNAIIHREHARIGTWTKACAIQALGSLSREVPDMLVANLFHTEPMLQELAAENIFKLSPKDFARHVAKLSYEARERVERLSRNGGGEQHGEGASSLYAKVSLLSRARGFGGLSWSVLIRMASLAEDVVCRPADVVPAADDPEGTLYVVARGLLATEDGARGVLGKSSVVAARAFTGRAHALEPTWLLRLDGESLVHLASDRVELVPAILRAGSRPPIGTLSSLSMISSHQSTIISPQSF